MGQNVHIMTTIITIMYAAAFGILGAAIGSFLNVCVDRLPAGGSLLHPRSRCDACGRQLSLPDLVPVFSYLALHGRCRYCRSLIPRRVLWVEACTASLFTLLYLYQGLGIEMAVQAAYGALFLVIAVIDLEKRLILNRIVYPAAAATLLIDLLHRQPTLVSGLLGGATGLVLLLMPAIIVRRGMGWGDIKMAGLVGIATGFPLVFVALFLGVVSGGVVAGTMVLAGIRKGRDTVPFGPFLSLAAMTTLLWGDAILAWYLTLI